MEAENAFLRAAISEKPKRMRECRIRYTSKGALPFQAGGTDSPQLPFPFLMSIQISTVVGARPNFMKIGPIFEEARRRSRLRLRLIHTGQHYSSEMSDSFFQDLSIPAPDINLGVGGGSHTSQTAAIMQRLEPELDATGPISC